ncbi:hypothetical protein [Polaribacter sp. Q13]|uniref:hypothetical protein n=1 Tax=Polaribacter sp. Q13 TaxID=2806551 RepID=UPI00193C28B2|nr:hypothetical protein [Polaribacter sp. Q13]QVY66902.1 hypothetical protein JOP69_06360 [Polaribacter sp. Q13]
MFKNFNWNRLLSILGLIILVFSIIGVIETFKKKKVSELDLKVEAIILEAPEDCSTITTRSGYCTLEYNGNTYIKRAGNKYCHLVSGKETVAVLTNQNHDDIYFIGEYNQSDFISLIILLALAILSIIKGLKN